MIVRKVRSWPFLIGVTGSRFPMRTCLPSGCSHSSCSSSHLSRRILPRILRPSLPFQLRDETTDNELWHVFKLRTERGCVEDQPQHTKLSDSFQAIHTLRLVLRTQPRSENRL